MAVAVHTHLPGRRFSGTTAKKRPADPRSRFTTGPDTAVH